MATGTVKKLVLAKGFGFLETTDGDVFFHANQLGTGLEWGEHLMFQRVMFDLERHGEKFRAVSVQAAG
jgi:cold shock CspA family protein